MVAVDRFGLLLVETRRVRVHIDDVERRDELVEGEDVTVGRDRPAEQSEVVQETFADESLVALQEQVGTRIPLRELLRAVAEHERHVSESRDERCHAGFDERAVEHDLPRRRRHEVLTAQHVGDAHQRVVDRVDERVERHAVRPHDDEVAEAAGREGHVAAHEVVVRDVLVRHLEPQGGRAPLRTECGLLVLGEVAVVVVVSLLLRSAVRFVARVDLLGRREALVHEALLEQPIEHLAMDVVPLRLAVGRMGPSDLDALVPVEAEPPERVDQLVVALLAVAVRVRVLDSEHERSAVVAREAPVEQCRANETDVWQTRR